MLKYWESKCEPVGKKAKAKAKGGAPAAAEEEKKTDPAYPGKAYTFSELLAAYKGVYNKKACAAYWEETCKPVKSKKAKGKAKAEAKAKAAPETPTGKKKDPVGVSGAAFRL